MYPAYLTSKLANLPKVEGPKPFLNIAFISLKGLIKDTRTNLTPSIGLYGYPTTRLIICAD